MGNGIEQDVRELRALMQKIDRDGCGHNQAHEGSIKELWAATDNIKKGMGAFFMKIIFTVMALVLTLMIGNFFITKQTLAGMETSTAASISAENQKILLTLTEEIRDIRKEMAGR